MKKTLSMLLALSMLLGLLTTMAFAAGEYTITIQNSTDGHTYSAYQIFKGDLSSNATNDNVNGTIAVLANVEWGTGIKDADFLSALKGSDKFKVTVGETTKNVFADCTTAAAVAKALADNPTYNSEFAQAFADVASKHLTEIAVSSTDAGDNYTISGLDAGYYLIMDSGTVGNYDAKTAFIMEVVESSTVIPKADVPKVDKSVKNNQDDTEHGEAVDTHIGDTVTFTLTATMPSTFQGYESYKVVFHDTMSAGLTFVDGENKTVGIEDFVVKVGTKQINSGYTVGVSGTSITVSIEDVLDKKIGAVADGKITVEYQAVVNSNAEIGQPGNSNKVYLEFSNDPNWDSTPTEPTGKTPEDEVLVFTYELDVTKVDGANTDTKLDGAQFVLMNADQNKVAKVSEGKFVEWVEDSSITKNADKTYPAEYTLTSGTDGKFIIAGLDDGTYYLKETKAPTGYNLLADPVKVEIIATIQNTEDNPALTALQIKVDEGTGVDGTLASGVVAGTVTNNKGSVLPETGGIGTTIFYVLGGLMAVGAGVLLVAKKRMDA